MQIGLISLLDVSISALCFFSEKKIKRQGVKVLELGSGKQAAKKSAVVSKA